MSDTWSCYQARCAMQIHFGEFLVRRGLIDRYQLLQVLMFQARYPRVPLGECVVACGFLAMREIELSLVEHDAARAARRLARGTSNLPVVRDAD
jgi:hypothetical protein